MASLVEQMQAAGIQPSAQPQTGGKKSLAQQMQEAGIQPSATQQPKKDGFFKSTLKGIAEPFAQFGTTALNVGSSIRDLAFGDQAGAARDLEKTRNVPFLGPTKPLFTGNEGKVETVKKVIGTGADIASNFIGGGASVNAAKAGFGGLVKQGIKTGIVGGATGGALQQGGQTLRNNGSVGEAALNATVGAGTGAAVGGVLGGGLAVLGAGASKLAGRSKDAFEQSIEGTTAKASKEVTSPVLGSIQEKALGAKQAISGSRERMKINVFEKQKARQAFESYAPEKRSAVQKGLIPRDVDLIQQSTPSEKNIFKDLLFASDNYANNRKSPPPSSIVGRELRKPLENLQSQVRDAGASLDKAVAPIKKQPIPNVWRDMAEEMDNVPGLRGVNVTEDGVLDFSNTALRGSGTKAERMRLQSAFDDAVNSNAEQAHRLRQELFEEQGGRKASGIKSTDTADKGIEAIRKGISTSLGAISPEYGAANQRMAQLLQVKGAFERMFGSSKKLGEDIFDTKAGTMLRRLTSNAKSGQDIQAMLNDLQTILQENGVSSDINFVALQEFLNLLNRYYDIAGDTSLLGIIKAADIPRGKGDLLMKVINELTDSAQASPETAKSAIADLLGTAQKLRTDAPDFSKAAVPKTAVKKTSLLGGQREFSKNLSSEDRLIESAAFRRLDNEWPTVRQRYMQENNKIVNADEFRPLFEGYNGANAPVVQEPASEASKRLLLELLNEQPRGSTVYATAGGAGSGKSTASSQFHIFDEEKDLIFDSVLKSKEKAQQFITEANSRGLKPEIVYIYRNVEDAWKNGVEPRRLKTGRAVPRSVHENGHNGALQAMKDILSDDALRGKFKLQIIDNSRGIGNAKLVEPSNYADFLKNK